LGYYGVMETIERLGGRQRDPQTDIAAVEAVLDLSRNSLYRRWKTKDALYLDVLDSINGPLPEFAGPTALDDVAEHLAVLAERTVDRRASRMRLALNAEAEVFPELHRRYFEEIVAPRREAMFKAIRRGIESGEIRPDIDVALVNEVLVSPMLARMASRNLDDLDPVTSSRRITQLVLDGARPR